ncbi:hypothetical protein CDD81_4831 [Ophiocordyceps australis]|uniref:Beta-glucosidase n=1 Tax=Ophiocordyceps australis TaxID=1399860 RepID=A0A2C5Y688_9HYPO|nr:hypothetical protein CDD81_4831 [Ophiocordyceps australis]
MRPFWLVVPSLFVAVCSCQLLPRENATQPIYSFKPFTYTTVDTAYATSVSRASRTTRYAAPSQDLISSLLPLISYTTWGNWDPSATSTATNNDDKDDEYGQAAWTALWERANPPNFTATGLFTATVSPTAIPSSQLVLPPLDAFGPPSGPDFPAGFIFGVASSAGQIEGAAARDGKAPSALELIIQDARPKNYVTNEFYYYYKQDIERMAAMGVRHFSFSIPWTRILPFALPGTPVNQAAIEHYNDMIDFIIEKGMTPIITLLHFDTPLQFFAANLSSVAASGMLGFGNGAYQNQSFPDAFVNYARIVMAHYADRVPIWFTFNEPLIFSYDARAIDHVLRAHARVYHFYRQELRGTGQVSLKLSNNFGVPRNASSSADVAAANHFNSFYIATFLNPLVLGTDYPDLFKKTFPNHIALSPQDLAYMKGTVSFISVDMYTATVVSAPVPGRQESILECATNPASPFRPFCVAQSSQNMHGWNIGYRSHSYVYNTPSHFRAYFNYLYNTWRTPLLLAEFGFPVFREGEKNLPDQLFDSPRSLYYLGVMHAVLQAIWQDGVPVLGALAWSFADDWEFGDYAAQFGLQVVNRTTQQRYYKKSFFDLVAFMRARGVY